VVAYLGAVASALPIFLWNYALRYVPASAAALYINLVPVLGLVPALLFGERVGAAQLVGGALAVAGVLLETPSPRKGAGGGGPGLGSVRTAPGTVTPSPCTQGRSAQDRSHTKFLEPQGDVPRTGLVRSGKRLSATKVRARRLSDAAGIRVKKLDRFLPSGPFTGPVPHVQGEAFAP
jgi:hypothetical protein